MKSSKARVAIDGQPNVVIKQGKILENELSKLRLNMDDLSMLLREQKVYSVQDIENAVFEPNGKDDVRCGSW
ncbi:YetF domain-containing protein [Oceanobacillus sp. Castelsardo]|uniref:YetF domain-containing protein n=1 Tax=Oceanobacillus sp. Castelsardo TaxID=1851204 RepID=UPI000838DF6D|nr:YetF domain-containing protein [Oceanobacillus sp. Castelsardo]